MRVQETALLLRVFIGEDDRFDGKPLYEAIVIKAREGEVPEHVEDTEVARGSSLL